VERVLEAMGTPDAPTLDDVVALDAAARRAALAFTAAKAA